MIRTDDSDVFHRFLDLPYPNVERGEGVWLTTIDGRRILDACSGGAMVACLGHGVHELDEEGVDPDALLAETDRNAEENRRTALRLLERYLDQVARLGSAAIER